MMLLAASLSKEDILDKLREDLAKYDALPTGKAKEEAYDSVEMDCVILMTKRVAPDAVAAAKVGKEMDELEALRSVSQYNSNNNNNKN